MPGETILNSEKARKPSSGRLGELNSVRPDPSWCEGPRGLGPSDHELSISNLCPTHFVVLSGACDTDLSRFGDRDQSVSMFQFPITRSITVLRLACLWWRCMLNICYNKQWLGQSVHGYRLVLTSRIISRFSIRDRIDLGLSCLSVCKQQNIIIPQDKV